MAAVAYVLRNLLAASSQEVAFAARRAFEASDRVAQELLGVEAYTAEVEKTLSAHSVVQFELGEQSRDLRDLSVGAHGASVVVTRAKNFEAL